MLKVRYLIINLFLIYKIIQKIMMKIRKILLLYIILSTTILQNLKLKFNLCMEKKKL
jgi:hypothetical protein